MIRPGVARTPVLSAVSATGDDDRPPSRIVRAYRRFVELSLAGRRALVCGSTQGIGRACAVELASLGASVTLVARDAVRLEAAADELPHAANQRHDWIAADLADHASLSATIDARLDAADPWHILVTNTGGPPAGAMLDATPEQLLRAFDSLLLCAHVLAQRVVSGMKRANYGRIINITSTSVKQPIPNLGLSNAVRAAVANWAKTLSLELAPHGITVNNVLPGYTDTARLGELFSAKAARTGASVEEVLRDTVATIPAGRLGRPEEVAAAVAFLATPAAAYINGINLPVDGGRTASL